MQADTIPAIQRLATAIERGNRIRTAGTLLVSEVAQRIGQTEAATLALLNEYKVPVLRGTGTQVNPCITMASFLDFLDRWEMAEMRADVVRKPLTALPPAKVRVPRAPHNRPTPPSRTNQTGLTGNSNRNAEAKVP